jgi:ribonucleoside-diphosphate reductase beta chain
LTAGIVRDGYATISRRGLQWDSVPMRLFQKAKRLGTWDPQALDFSRDAADWAAFDAVEKDFLLRTESFFSTGCSTRHSPAGRS